MEIPTDEQIRALHEKYAPTPEAFDLVYTHCRVVCEIAERLLGDSGVDAGLVRAGCLLHDIGVYHLYDSAGRLDHARYIRHGVLGHEILRNEGLPERLCRFCSHHTGMGLTRSDVLDQGLALPPADYLAETPEERLVMYADKFHSKSSPPTFVTFETCARSLRRFGEDKTRAFTAMRDLHGVPQLLPLSTKYGHTLV